MWRRRDSNPGNSDCNQARRVTCAHLENAEESTSCRPLKFETNQFHTTAQVFVQLQHTSRAPWNSSTTADSTSNICYWSLSVSRASRTSGPHLKDWPDMTKGNLYISPKYFVRVIHYSKYHFLGGTFEQRMRFECWLSSFAEILKHGVEPREADKLG